VPAIRTAAAVAVFEPAEHVDVTTADGKPHDVESRIKGDRTAAGGRSGDPVIWALPAPP